MRSRILPKARHASATSELREYYDSHPEEFKVDDGGASGWTSSSAAGQARRRRGRPRVRRADLANRGPTARTSSRCATSTTTATASCARARASAEDAARSSRRSWSRSCSACARARSGRWCPIGNGFHVFKLVKREYAGVKPFDEEVQKDIRNKLRNEMANREMKKFVDNLRKHAVIEFARRRADPSAGRAGCLTRRHRLARAVESRAPAGHSCGGSRPRWSRTRPGAEGMPASALPSRVRMPLRSSSNWALMASRSPVPGGEVGLELVALLGHGLAGLELPGELAVLLLQVGDLLLGLVALGAELVDLLLQAGHLGLQRLDPLVLVARRRAGALGTAPQAEDGHDRNHQRLVNLLHLVLAPWSRPDACWLESGPAGLTDCACLV